MILLKLIDVQLVLALRFLVLLRLFLEFLLLLRYHLLLLFHLLFQVDTEVCDGVRNPHDSVRVGGTRDRFL